MCPAGSSMDSLPMWLRSLMMLCSMSRDSHIQHTAVASLLELVNHSQSLALVIEDKQRRYRTTDTNPLSGRLQMVTVPPISPAVLRALEERTDFYQVCWWGSQKWGVLSFCVWNVVRGSMSAQTWS